MITITLDKSKKLQCKYSGYVSFKYDPEIVKILRTLPFKHYNPETKVWEIPSDKVPIMYDMLRMIDEVDLLGDMEILRTEHYEIPDDFEFKTKPFEHQLEAINYGLNKNCWFLGDEMGLGKTKTAIDIAVIRKQLFNYNHCLIVCGVNTLKWNWVNEIKTHSNENSWILGQKTLKNGNIKIGSSKDKLNDLLDIDNLPYFIITNVESFRDKNFAETVQKLVKQNKINMCIADEVHKMKNPTSQQTKGFLKCLPECRIAMTGTPLMNSPLDLYVILKWLGYESNAFYSFKNHYCIMGGYGGYEIIGYKNTEMLTEQLNSIMLRRLKEDVLDLPEKVYVDEYVEMLPKQTIIYNEVEADIKAHIDMISNDINPLATLIRLRQATGYTGILSSDIKESAKLDRMVDIVEEALSNKQKVVIFSNWTSMTNAIDDVLAKIKHPSNSSIIASYAALITGETPDSDRQQIVDAFQNTDDLQVLIGTIGAMGTGLTLTAGTVVIFVDHPWSMALYEQAVDRCHRVGQKNNITIYNLITKNTIDERIWDLVKTKGVMSDVIVDGKQLNNREIFEYLLS